jgi:NTP pyrophosphatase (non-canonical NTP hydrolase)
VARRTFGGAGMKEPTEAERNTVKAAQLAFEEYAGMGGSDLPGDELAALQVELARWQSRNFDQHSMQQTVLGVCEEAGELAYCALKSSQKIRGMDDQARFRALACDAIADCAIFLMQTATSLRLDFGALLRLTAEEVMKREWNRNPLTGESRL